MSFSSNEINLNRFPTAAARIPARKKCKEMLFYSILKKTIVIAANPK